MARFTIPEAEELVDRWLERDLAAATRREYRTGIRLILKWFRSKKTSLTVESILDYKDHLRDKGLSARTINNRLMLLSSFCSWLVSKERLKSNPVRHVRKARVTTDHARDALPVDQVQKILERTKGQPLKARAILHLIVFCGLRVAEVTRLKFSDVREIEGEWSLLILGKGMDEPIPQPLNEPCLGILQEFMRQSKSQGRNPLFSGKKGQPLTPEYVSILIKGMLRMAGFDDPRITAHSLRHSFATILLSSGVALETVSKLLRHKNLSTTMIYARVSQESIKDGSGLFSELVLSKSDSVHSE